MSKVVFLINYEILPEKRDEYLTIVRELKFLVKAEGLEEYSVFEDIKRKNVFQEKYTFLDRKAYEDFDDVENERVEILMSKLSSLLKDNTTKYNTFEEITG